MNAEKATRAILTSSTSVTSHVGSRIYPLKLPQNVTYPAITYQKVSGASEHTHGGPAGLASPALQVDVWVEEASGYGTLKDLGDAVRIALQGFNGTSTGVNVQEVFFDNEFDLWEDAVDVYHLAQRYTIWHDEATS